MAREQRRLAAILIADVVGYSKLVGSDEAGTLAKLSALRRDVIEPVIDRYAGRLFKSVGDGFLVEFASAVQAVTAAQAIQQANASGLLPLRIGIHIGDVVVQGDDLMGDGVNVAARIEGVADAGGIVISREVHAQVRDKLDIGFEDKGEVSLKNLMRPVHVFALAVERPAASTPLAALPDKPSIAVLPFQNMSGDPEQEYFADGMVEEIITALSHDRGLFVTARNSTFTYKGRAVDIRQVGRELGVRYVLEGSVRKVGGKVRITGQLIEAGTGSHLWADRFDGNLEDIFELQDQIASAVASVIRPAVETAEIERATRKTANLQAYDYFLRASAAFYKMTSKDLDDASDFAERALALDPTFARCHALVAGILGNRVAYSYSRDPTGDAGAAERAAQRALALDGNDAAVLVQYGLVVVLVLGRYEEGVPLLDRAIDLDPNLATAWIVRGVCKNGQGRIDEAIRDFEHALRLSPRDPRRWWAQHGLAFAHLIAGRYDEAVSLAAAVLQMQPSSGNTLRVAIAAHALAGRMDEAQKVLAAHMRIEPETRISTLRESYLRRLRPEVFDVVVAGLRKAGFPE